MTGKQARAQAIAGTLPKGERCERCDVPGAFRERTRQPPAYSLHAHHDDYDRPEIVRWLCARCHRRWHIENGPGANRADAPGQEPKRRPLPPTPVDIIGWADDTRGALLWPTNGA